MKNKSKAQPAQAPIGPADETRPETDYEHSQRYLNDIDQAVFRGNHPPTKMGPRAVIHKVSVAERAPHIYKESK